MESHIFTRIIQFVRAKLIICCIGGVFFFVISIYRTREMAQ